MSKENVKTDKLINPIEFWNYKEAVSIICNLFNANVMLKIEN